MKNKILAIMITLLSVIAGRAQIAQGGNYKLEQAVIASGGTSADSTGNTYKLESVIGEPVAGTTSTSTTYSLKGGFLSAPTVAPTAAAVSISGRVSTLDGSGLMNARVTLTDFRGNTQTVLTKKLGAFRFDDLAAGEIYIITIASRRYTFQQQVLIPTENLLGVEFVAQQPAILF